MSYKTKVFNDTDTYRNAPVGGVYDAIPAEKHLENFLNESCILPEQIINITMSFSSGGTIAFQGGISSRKHILLVYREKAK